MRSTALACSCAGFSAAFCAADNLSHAVPATRIVELTP